MRRLQREATWGYAFNHERSIAFCEQMTQATCLTIRTPGTARTSDKPNLTWTSRAEGVYLERHTVMQWAATTYP